MSLQEEFSNYGITSKEATHNNLVRDRIQTSINPDENSYGYNEYDGTSAIETVAKATKDFIKGEKSNDTVEDKNSVNQDIFNLYLGKPVEDRSNTKLKLSEFNPSKSKDKDVNYFKIEDMWGKLDGLFGNRPLKDFIDSTEDSREVHDYNLGDFKITKGEDENGKYLSYYDKWDLHPTGKSKGNPLNYLEVLGIAEDQSQGVGKPIEFYDRKYYQVVDGIIQWKTL